MGLRCPYRASVPVAQPVDQYPDHAPTVLGSSPRDGLAELRAGVEEVLGPDVAADRAGGHRGVPGTNVSALDQAYQPPALEVPALCRRPLVDRAAA